MFKNWVKSKKQINRLNNIYGPLKGKAFPGRATLLIKILNLDEKISILFLKNQIQKNRIFCSWN